MPELTWREIVAGGVFFLILFVGYYLFLPFLPRLPWQPPVTPVGAPTWSFVGWYQEGVMVTEAIVNVPVTLKIKLVGVTPSSIGTLRIEIRKDIRFATDVTVHTDSKSISLMPDQETIIETTFTPDKVTDGIAEYFFKLYWNEVIIYDPKTREERFGLKVVEPMIEVEYVEAEFEGIG